MYCSSCGALLPEGRAVCEGCHSGQAASAFVAAPAAVHPACHAIAVLVGIKLALGLFYFSQTINWLRSSPQYARNARSSFLMIPVSLYTNLMLSVLLMVVTGACVVGLYKRNRTAWGVLLGLKALFLPFSLYSLFRIMLMLVGDFNGSANLSNFSLIPQLLIYLVQAWFGPLLDAAVIVLLLKFKYRLLR